ncbi:hypothetical protein NUH88_19645 [Nisaea acidiphila]|uniref:Methyltransferase type 11 domain-containing protein n=1 Tax=Nisaea acidiphila TaxID=1862145 RepID=A0A9J7ASY3_9PROT|nr:hypothetical protein [Nisaea acidiphila]UUX49601.1 hypothetical protein NUH88_19645 [Nisaea acidiphila]
MPNSLQKLNIGCGSSPTEGWVNLDFRDGPGVDVVFDLESCGENRLPLEDNSISEFKASHILEHIRNILPLMEELHRVATDGALLTAAMPHIGSDGAWGDPTHVRGMSVFALRYFSQPWYHFADYGYRGDWDIERVRYKVGRKRAGADIADHQRLMDRVDMERNFVNEMVADLRAVKPARPRGEGKLPSIRYEFELLGKKPDQ